MYFYLEVHLLPAASLEEGESSRRKINAIRAGSGGAVPDLFPSPPKS